MTTNLDLSRDIGRMEAEIAGVKHRLDKIDDVLERIDSRLARMETIESERKGTWKTIAAFAAMVGGVAAAVVKYLLGHI